MSAILRVQLRTSLLPLGEDEDRIIEHLRIGERLAAELGDGRRRSRMIARPRERSKEAGNGCPATRMPAT